MYINKYFASGAVVENFIEDIFNKTCEGSGYKLIRKEFSEWSGGNPPAPGTSIHPKFEVVHKEYSDRVISTFSQFCGDYCSDMDFFPYYREVNLLWREASEKRVKEYFAFFLLFFGKAHIFLGHTNQFQVGDIALGR